MQLGFLLVLTAIAAGMTSALLEKTQVKVAWCFMALCGLLLMAGAWDIGMHPQGTIRVWGAGAANAVITLLWLIGLGFEAGCVVWLIKGLWRRVRR